PQIGTDSPSGERAGPSLAAEARGPLLEKRAYALGVVSALEAGGDQAGEGRPIPLLRLSLRLLDGALGRAKGERRIAGDRSRVAGGEGVELGPRHDAIHETQAERFVGRVRARGEEDLGGSRDADDADQPADAARVVAEPEPCRGEREARVGGGE